MPLTYEIFAIEKQQQKTFLLYYSTQTGKFIGVSIWALLSVYSEAIKLRVKF